MRRAHVASLGIASLLAVVALAGACAPASEGADDESTQSTAIDDVAPAAGTQAGCITKVIEPSADPSPEEAAMYKAAPAKRIVFLNRHGGTYKPGPDNSAKNTSSIPSFTAKISPYEKSEAAWKQVLACVQAQFADYNVTITDQDPGNVPHVEAVVGGHPGQAGLGGGVGGIAPMNGDCSTVETAIVYVFTQALGGVQHDCEVTAHEVGHAIGLDHEYLCKDPMTYLTGCGAKTFQDEAAWCGEYAARQCMCGGKQNSVQFLLGRLGPNEGDPGGGGPPDPGAGGGAPDPAGAGGGGPDPIGGDDKAAPSVAIVSPADGALLPKGGSIQVVATASDDVGLAAVELIWQFDGTTVVMDCASPPGGVQCAQQGDTFTWQFPVGGGERLFSVRARDTAGNESVTPVRSIQLGANGGGGGGKPPQQPAGPPVVSVTEPAVGSKAAPGQIVPVRVAVKDDGMVTDVSLLWKSPSGDVTYSLAPLGAGTWGIDLTLSAYAKAGKRRLRVTAWDDEGNSTTHPDVVIFVP